MSADLRRIRIIVALDDRRLAQGYVEALPSPHFEVRVIEADFAAAETFQPAEVDVVIASAAAVAGDVFSRWWDQSGDVEGPAALIMVGGAQVPSFMTKVTNLYIFDEVPGTDIIDAVVFHAASLTEFARELTQVSRDLAIAVAELDAFTNRLHAAGTCDPDTGLLNRGYFVSMLDAEIASGRPFSVIFLDIDHFQKYNDTHGHEEGDYLLQQFVDVLCSRFKANDLIARYGADEFGILLPDADSETAIEMAEGLRHHLEEFPFLGRETQPLGCITICASVASYPADGMTAGTILNAAETAVRLAKKTGRNKVLPAGSSKPNPDYAEN